MRKMLTYLTIILILLVFTGCESEKPKQIEPEISKPVQTVPSDQKPEFSISAGTDKSAELPKGYPSDKFPLYGGSYIAGVLELDGGYTLTAFSKDEDKTVIAFYTKVLDGAKVTMDTKTSESLTSFGTKDGYTYNMDVSKSSEMEGYQTSIIIILQPLK